MTTLTFLVQLCSKYCEESIGSSLRGIGFTDFSGCNRILSTKIRKTHVSIQINFSRVLNINPHCRANSGRQVYIVAIHKNYTFITYCYIKVAMPTR